MKQGIFEIIENTALTESVFKMVLKGDTSAITASGQFVNILLDVLEETTLTISTIDA